MCADLAAFVAHKQAHCSGSSSRRTDRAAQLFLASVDGEEAEADDEGDGSTDAASEGVRVWLRGIQAGRSASGAGAPPDHWRRLPEVLRVKLLLLNCFLQAAACYAGARRPAPLSPCNLLVSELLVPEEDMRMLCRTAAGAKGGEVTRPGTGAPDGRPRNGSGGVAGDTVSSGVSELRRLSMRVVAEFGRLVGACRGNGGDDTMALDARPKQHDDVVAQLRHRLARLVGQDRDTMRGGLGFEGGAQGGAGG